MGRIRRMGIGDRIKRARTLAGMTPDELARELKITGSAVRSWEKGVSQPRPKRYSVIADALGAHLNYISSGVEPPLVGEDAESLDRRASEFAEIMLSLSDEQINLLYQVAREFHKT